MPTDVPALGRPCPCGCKRPVNPGRTYATAGCVGRRNFTQGDPETIRRWKREARRVGVVTARMRVLEQLRALPADQALWKAYWLGYGAGWRRHGTRKGTAA